MVGRLNDDYNPLLDDEDDDFYDGVLGGGGDDDEDDALPSFGLEDGNILPSGESHVRELIDLRDTEFDAFHEPSVDGLYVDEDLVSGESDRRVMDYGSGAEDYDYFEDESDSVLGSVSASDVGYAEVPDDVIDDVAEDSDYDSDGDFEIVDGLYVPVAQFAGDESDDDEFDDDEDLNSILDRGSFDLDSDDDYDDDEMYGFKIDDVISRGIDLGASDVHLVPNSYVAYSILGDIAYTKEFGILRGDVAVRAYSSMTSNVAQHLFVDEFELDTSYVVQAGKYKGRRTRLNVGYTMGELFMVLRIIADVIPSPESLGISPMVQSWTTLAKGLVLVCGPTGSGKSTSFASLIRKRQLEAAGKIITIEKPVEFIYGSVGRGLVVQREVGKDTHSFANGLTSAMRQAVNVIMVGEVRNREEVDEALRASETGHLTFTTMHTNSPAATITRIMSLYNGDEQLRVLGSLKDNVRGIMNQVLVKSIDGNSRVAVHSILAVNDEVASYIGKGDSHAIEMYMRKHGLTIEHALVRAVREGKCSLADARVHVTSPFYFDELVENLKPL